MIVAVKNEMIDTVKLLLDGGADSSSRENKVKQYSFLLSINVTWLFLKDGQSSVTLALHLRNKDLLSVLIENGADINTPSEDVIPNQIFELL